MHVRSSLSRRGSAATIAVVAVLAIAVIAGLGYFISSTGEEMAQSTRQQSERMRAAREMQLHAAEIQRLQMQQAQEFSQGEEMDEQAVQRRQAEILRRGARVNELARKQFGN